MVDVYVLIVWVYCCGAGGIGGLIIGLVIVILEVSEKRCL